MRVGNNAVIIAAITTTLEMTLSEKGGELREEDGTDAQKKL